MRREVRTAAAELDSVQMERECDSQLRPCAETPHTPNNGSLMPTVLRSGPYRFYFYSHEPNEPPHVHVDKDDLSAKFWLQPVGLARNFGFSAKELRRLQNS